MRGLALLVALALGACATMSGPTCRSADWEKLGESDGARGAPATRFDERREACAGHGVEAREDAWRKGYARGHNEFCTPGGAYVASRAGEGDVSLCTGEEFQIAFERGRRVNTLLREVQELYRQAREIADAARFGTATDYELAQRRSGADLYPTLERRMAELERLDESYSTQYDVEKLTDADLR
jgi:Protein of unknown function (DUF2799)